MASGKKFLVGVFDDESVLIDAIGKIRNSGVKIFEVYTPFPVHGLDSALGYKPSNLPVAAFLFGLVGTITALTMEIGMMGFDWPMIIGGKPFIPLPDFIPITFELTVLFSALGMVFTFLIISDLNPFKLPLMFDKRSTDDKFVMAIDIESNHSRSNEETITSLLRENGASEVNSKTFE